MRDKVVLVCYACTPDGATEHGLGWQWVLHTSKFKDVILVTRPGRKGLAEKCEENGIELVEVAVPSVRRKLTQPLGDIGIWLRIYAWKNKANKKIKEITKAESISYVHLITFHSIWMPDILKDVSTKKVWGPVSGAEHVPESYMRFIGPEMRKEKIRNKINKWIETRLGKKVKDCDLIVCGNSQTLDLVKEQGAKHTRLILPNAVEEKERGCDVRQYDLKGTLNFAFVGSCQGRRTLPLLLQALSEKKDLDYKVEIAGTGPSLAFWKERVEELGIEEKVVFHGWVGKDTVNEIYERAHIFAFTTIRDGGGSGMLEALERGIPVLALNWGGPADVVANTGAGKLISVDNPERSIMEIKDWLDTLIRDERAYNDMATAVASFDFSPFYWETKIINLMDAVKSIEA